MYLSYPHYLYPYNKKKIVCWLEVVNSISLYICNILLVQFLLVLLALLVQKILVSSLANKRPIFPPLGNILYLLFPPQKGLNLWQKREIGTLAIEQRILSSTSVCSHGGRPGF